MLSPADSRKGFLEKSEDSKSKYVTCSRACSISAVTVPARKLLNLRKLRFCNSRLIRRRVVLYNLLQKEFCA